MPVCMAKTQYSFSDDASKLGAPTGFRITVRNVKVSAGAGFIVALTGDIMTMPGLPKHPAAENIDVRPRARSSACSDVSRGGEDPPPIGVRREQKKDAFARLLNYLKINIVSQLAKAAPAPHQPSSSLN